jgi:hypothetical protein
MAVGEEERDGNGSEAEWVDRMWGGEQRRPSWLAGGGSPWHRVAPVLVVVFGGGDRGGRERSISLSHFHLVDVLKMFNQLISG